MCVCFLQCYLSHLSVSLSAASTGLFCELVCEECEINGGKMDQYINGCYCSNKQNFAVGVASAYMHTHKNV